MSLDDRFNPNDGSLIGTIDKAIFEFNKNIATKWQDKTYRSKDSLERVLYFTSAAMLGGYTAKTMNLIMAIPAAFAAFKGLDEMARPKSAKHEEIQNEAMGLGSKFTKYVNVVCYGLGVIETLWGVGDLAAGAVSGNNELYVNAFKNIAFGLGILCWISADYMAKSGIGTPPPKPKRESLLERIKGKMGELLPQPTQPVLGGAYSVSENYALASKN